MIRNFLYKNNRTFYELVSAKHLDDIQLLFHSCRNISYIEYVDNKFIINDNQVHEINEEPSLEDLNKKLVIYLRHQKIKSLDE